MGAFLLVGVAGFGINNVITDLGSNTVARVGSEEITSREFLRAYQSQLSRIAAQMGTVPTMSQAESMGLPTAVLLNLSEGAALDLLASQFGLGVSQDKLSQMLREDPSFQGTLGTFDATAFRQVLQASGWTEAEYFEARGDEAKRQQILAALFADTGLPEVAAELINSYAASTRTIDYVTLTEASVEPPAEPTEEELAAYLAEHQSEFRTVETRRVQMLDLSIPALAATKTVDEAAIAAEYERTRDSLTTPERRTIEQVALTTPQQQTWFENGLRDGKDFGTLVEETGLTPTAIGTLAQSEITDAALAGAAFGLEEGAFTVIEGIGGRRAVHVPEIVPAGQPALEDAREEIASRLATAQARNEINEVLDQIEELRAAFRPLPEIAQRFGLDLYEADVTAGGSELSILPNLTPEDRQRVSQAIFRAEQGQLIPSVSLTGNAHLWFDLVEVAPARDQTLDEVREEVAAALTEERANEALLALGEELADRVRAGEALADIALSLNLFPQISAPFTRFRAEDGSIDAVVASAAFAGGPDHVGSVVSGTGEHIVFQVVDSSAPAEPLDAQTVASLDNEAVTGLYGDFVGALRDDAELRVNQQALTQLLTLNFGQ